MHNHRISIGWIACWMGLTVFSFGLEQDQAHLSARELLHNIENKTYTGQRIELRFTDSGLVEILDKFQELSGLVFHLSPRVDPNQFPPRRYNFLGYAWDRALDTILADHGLSLRLEGEELWIDLYSPPKDMSFPAFMIGMITMAAVSAVIIGIIAERKRRRRIQDREKRIMLDPATVEDAIQRLRYLFQVEKIYRNGQISLDSLSERLKFQPYQLSGVINSRLGKSFSEFVADYRVEEVKRRLADPTESATILNIALDAGFGTKASFNRIFKERTGLTPSEFRKKSQPAL